MPLPGVSRNARSWKRPMPVCDSAECPVIVPAALIALPKALPPSVPTFCRPAAGSQTKTR